MVFEKALCQFLLRYRTTPYPSMGETLSELMFGRELQTWLALLLPDKLRKVEMQTNIKEGTRSFEPDVEELFRKS